MDHPTDDDVTNGTIAGSVWSVDTATGALMPLNPGGEGVFEAGKAYWVYIQVTDPDNPAYLVFTR